MNAKHLISGEYFSQVVSLKFVSEITPFLRCRPWAAFSFWRKLGLAVGAYHAPLRDDLPAENARVVHQVISSFFVIMIDAASSGVLKHIRIFAIFARLTWIA